MKRVKTMVVILVGLLVMSAATAVGLQDVPGASNGNDWPFGNEPRDAFDYVPPSDIVVTIGSTVLVPGPMVLELETALLFDPFFTRGQTDIIVLPTFGANQSLETGLRFNWWSASVDVDLSLSPWALVSTGGWLELHPPEWIILNNPVVVLDADIGWGPQWVPVDEWIHAFGGTLDVTATWDIATAWDTSLEAQFASFFDASITLPLGILDANFAVELDARTALPFWQDSPATLSAGVAARVLVLPTFGFGFDVILDFRLNSFHAYGLVGAGGTGIRAEAGAEITFGLSLFGGFEEDPE